MFNKLKNYSQKFKGFQNSLGHLVDVSRNLDLICFEID